MQNNKNKTCRLFLILGLITFSPSFAYAADYSAGDVCSAAGAWHQTNDAGGMDFLICDGSNWKAAVYFSSAGNNLRLDDDPATGSAGCLQYDGTNGKLQFSHDCSIYSDLGGSGGGTPAGADNQIQINSGGAFFASAHFLYTTAGDFIVGSTQKGDIGDSRQDKRMFFDKAKAAFRVGEMDDNTWDNANVGTNSIAMGWWANAAGERAFAMGANSDASGYASVAFGPNTIAQGDQSAAIGNTVQALSNYSMALSAGDHGDPPPRVSGAESMGIFVGDQSNVNVTASGVLSIMTTNGVGIDTATPLSQLHIKDTMTMPVLVLQGDSAALDLMRTGTGSFDWRIENNPSGELKVKVYANDDPSSPDETDIITITDSPLAFGIGDSTPDAALDVVGDINYTGVIVDVSDIRMKYDIEPLDSPLKKLAGLNGFAFKMKGDEKQTVEYGVSAQDVQKAFPELDIRSMTTVRSALRITA